MPLVTFFKPFNAERFNFSIIPLNKDIKSYLSAAYLYLDIKSYKISQDSLNYYLNSSKGTQRFLTLGATPLKDWILAELEVPKTEVGFNQFLTKLKTNHVYVSNKDHTGQKKKDELLLDKAAIDHATQGGSYKLSAITFEEIQEYAPVNTLLTIRDVCIEITNRTQYEKEALALIEQIENLAVMQHVYIPPRLNISNCTK